MSPTEFSCESVWILQNGKCEPSSASAKCSSIYSVFYRNSPSSMLLFLSVFLHHPTVGTWYFYCNFLSISSVQSLSCVWLFMTPRITARQATCPLPTPRVLSNSCPSSQWCHPAISSSVIPFTACSQSLPASGFFFQWVNSSHDLVKVLEFQPQHQSFQWTPRTDL